MYTCMYVCMYVCMSFSNTTLFHGHSLVANYASDSISICIQPLFLEVSRYKFAVDYNNYNNSRT